MDASFQVCQYLSVCIYAKTVRNHRCQRVQKDIHISVYIDFRVVAKKIGNAAFYLQLSAFRFYSRSYVVHVESPFCVCRRINCQLEAHSSRNIFVRYA